MTIRWHKSILITLVGVLFLLEGCAVTQPAFYRASEFKPESIGQITLLPAVDARIDKQVAAYLEEPLREKAATILKRKGYPVILSDSRESSTLTNDSLRAADPALIKRLGPPDARWIMVLALIDLNVVGSQDKVEVAGFLYDKEKGLLLWRDSVICLVGDGGVFGVLINDKRVDLAVSTAVDSLLGSIPE
ncbi:hypothetical protein NP603_21450 [Methylomonas sp. SURF-1]|uniref:DUF4136 domain-containing protein n=2 Tax=Methylomonas TaxID=416 RepID=A0ABU4UC51_9GAMM|nr:MULTISPECIES: hypothetical protein [unclassified Methylomonas]MCQ8183687.1 hypothetical protein [Methylomonas sp. SURF-1]MDX8126945.1 hypothetical protein [Methylomonas sp. OY6]